MLIAIGEPMTDGFKETEIARQLGRTPSWVSERLSELRTEILLQNGLLPPLTDAEYQALKQSIRTYGQWMPILVNHDLKLIDGGHRLMICDELNIPAKYLPITGLTADEEWELAVALNASRRHMTRQQKKKLIEHELMRDPGRSDRRIAAMCGVHHETVATVRNEITAAGHAWDAEALPQLERPPDPGEPPDTADVAVSATPVAVHPAAPPPATADHTRIDTIGRRQPARKPPRPKPDRDLAVLACPTCNADVRIIRASDGSIRLEHAA